MKIKALWILVFFIVLVWSGIGPKDYYTWFLEVLPAIVAFIILAYTYKSFRLTPLVYALILLHCFILMVGGHYTYAEVPFFDGFPSFLNTERNNYDKLAHFFQGFVPVMIAREIVIRKKVFDSMAWRNFFIVCFALALSAFYEFIEWWVALISDEAAESFLGTQGFVWDTQSDMFLALVGAVIALITLSRTHDKQLGLIQE